MVFRFLNTKNKTTRAFVSAADKYAASIIRETSAGFIKSLL